MYLLKETSGVYYFRIAMPRARVRLGYPRQIKISLLTKNRREAIARNLALAAAIKQLVDGEPVEQYLSFRMKLNEAVASLRQQYPDEGVVLSAYIPIPDTSPCVTSAETPLSLEHALQDFIAVKSAEALRPLTVKQLRQRIGHFVVAMDNKLLPTVTSADIANYVTTLNQEGRSAKSNKEYMAAVRQFLKWTVSVGYLPANPAAEISTRFRVRKLAREQRGRWSQAELAQLLQSPAFMASSADVRWVTRLVLYMGLRPSEACQLRGVDVGTEEGISYVKITDAGMRMRVKSPYALRKVPLHDVLLELGFHDFVRSRRHNTHLFGYLPRNTDGDWSKPYLQQFSRVLDALGWKAGSRVTSYGLRHTFIDELKRAGAQEHDVADLVGHATQSLTYGRYGKHATLSVLQQTVNLFCVEGGQAHENA